MRVGNVDLLLLSDGQFRLDGGALYGMVPKVLWQRVTPADGLNRVPMALHCLLILSAGKRILVDTGLGPKLSPRDRKVWGVQEGNADLLSSLARVGLHAGDIDVVINTHLHPDHSGGNTVLTDGRPVVAFPNAEYWIQRLEWAEACYPSERTRSAYLPENLLPLQDAGQLRLLSGDTEVTDEVRCVVTRGHTRAHQSVMIESGGQSAVFLGDLASRAVQMERLSWTTAIDTEPLETVETKRGMRDWALAHRSLLFFGHDTLVPMGYLVREGEVYRVEATTENNRGTL